MGRKEWSRHVTILSRLWDCSEFDARKRRNYLAWFGALLYLWTVLSRPGMLDTIEITKALAPWETLAIQ